MSYPPRKSLIAKLDVAEPQSLEAAARLVIVLAKLSRLDEALRLGTDLLAQHPTVVFKSLVYEGPLSLCTVLGDVYRLSGDFASAASFYREATKLKGGTPYAVSQAIVTMALSGDAKDISTLTAQHSGVQLTERISSVMRLANQTDVRLPAIKQVAASANVMAMESMSVSRLDLVAHPVAE